MKNIVLLSGGIDSSTLLAVVQNQVGKENTVAMIFSYGQRHLKEIDCAKKICSFFDVKYEILKVNKIFSNSNCALIDLNKEMPYGSYEEQKRNVKGVVNTYVPLRNLLLISSAASFAMSNYIDEKITINIAVHRDDYAERVYPDCTPDFIKYTNESLKEGSNNTVTLLAPFVNLNKAEIIKIGLGLKVPFEHTWSCYLGEQKPCGKCGTCIDRIKAFHKNGVKDPLIY